MPLSLLRCLSFEIEVPEKFLNSASDRVNIYHKVPESTNVKNGLRKKIINGREMQESNSAAVLY